MSAAPDSQMLPRLVLESVRDEAIFALDPTGRVVAWSPGAEATMGYAEAEVQGKHVSSFYPAEDVPLGGPGREIRRAEREGRIEWEGWQLHRDGERFWAANTTTALRDAGGRLVGFARITRDVTERLRAEEALRLSEARFGGIVSIAADAIVSVDESQRIILFNQGAEQIFGYAAAEAMGKPLDLLLPERSRPSHHDHVRGFARGSGEARRMGERSEIYGRRKDGEEFPAEASISRIEVGGQLIFTAVLRDVTGRKEAERLITGLLASEQAAREQAERAEQQARFLADASATLAGSLDYEATLRSVARLAVPAVADWCAVYLVDDDGTVRRLEMAHADPGRDRLVEPLRETRLDPRLSNPVVEVIRTGAPVLIDPVTEEFLDSIAEDADHGRLLRAIGFRAVLTVPLAVRDRTFGAITLATTEPGRSYDDASLLHAEELGRRAALAIENARLYAAAQSAVHGRDEVLRIVAHDLGNSLGAMVLTSRALREALPDEEGEESPRRLASGIYELARQMQRLRQDLLDVAGMDAGQLSVHPDAEPPAELIERVVDDLAPLAREKAVALEVEAGGPLPEVLADRGRVLQVLANLVGNALKFTPEGGRVAVGAEPMEGEVCFRVRDTGPGIAPEDLPHVFERFWRTREGNAGGAGLGLAIAEGIVRAHGGRIWAESTPGAGSTFSFTLPVASPAPSPAAAPLAPGMMAGAT
ncbi:MAG TPA: PAS domain S-box protein [Longimicrobiaceae bacterium]